MDKQQREYIHHLMLQYSDAMGPAYISSRRGLASCGGLGAGDLSDSVL